MCSLTVFDIYCLQMSSYLLFICHFDYGNFTFNLAFTTHFFALYYYKCNGSTEGVSIFSILSVLKVMTKCGRYLIVQLSILKRIELFSILHRTCHVMPYHAMPCHETWITGMNIHDDVNVYAEL